MLHRNDCLRTLILGNSGAGKSWLAERLARDLLVPAIDLDALHWEPGGYNLAREKSTACAMVREAAAGHGWIIEGVYGWLAREALPYATLLIWLEINDEECIRNVTQRGLRRGGDEASFEALLAWVAEYRVRQNANSFAANQQLFATFGDPKVMLQSRSEIEEFLNLTGVSRDL